MQEARGSQKRHVVYLREKGTECGGCELTFPVHIEPNFKLCRSTRSSFVMGGGGGVVLQTRGALHCKKRLAIFPSPFPARESLVSDISAGNGKIAASVMAARLFSRLYCTNF